MKPEELTQTLAGMMKDTADGKLDWRLEIQTTEGNPDKYTSVEEDKTWEIDECYVSYTCNFRGQEFCLITYEMIKTSGELTQTVNYVILPPVGVRVFSLHTLLPHSIEVNQNLITKLHNLWIQLMQIAKTNTGQVTYSISEASVVIEEESYWGASATSEEPEEGQSE